MCIVKNTIPVFDLEYNNKTIEWIFELKTAIFRPELGRIMCSPR